MPVTVASRCADPRHDLAPALDSNFVPRCANRSIADLSASPSSRRMRLTEAATVAWRPTVAGSILSPDTRKAMQMTGGKRVSVRGTQRRPRFRCANREAPSRRGSFRAILLPVRREPTLIWTARQHVEELPPRRHVELAERPSEMNLDCLLGDEQRLRDLAVGAARRRDLDHAPFARGQRVDPGVVVAPGPHADLPGAPPHGCARPRARARTACPAGRRPRGSWTLRSYAQQRRACNVRRVRTGWPPNVQRGRHVNR
jgi:hypothetical protein